MYKPIIYRVNDHAIGLVLFNFFHTSYVLPKASHSYAATTTLDQFIAIIFEMHDQADIFLRSSLADNYPR